MRIMVLLFALSAFPGPGCAGDVSRLIPLSKTLLRPTRCSPSMMSRT